MVLNVAGLGTTEKILDYQGMEVRRAGKVISGLTMESLRW